MTLEVIIGTFILVGLIIATGIEDVRHKKAERAATPEELAKHYGRLGQPDSGPYRTPQPPKPIPRGVCTSVFYHVEIDEGGMLKLNPCNCGE